MVSDIRHVLKSQGGADDKHRLVTVSIEYHLCSVTEYIPTVF